MSISAAETLEWLFHPRPADGAIDRQALAGLLVELARAVEPRTGQPDGVAPRDPRLEELRGLILGREIELLERLRQVIDDPERLGVAVGRALPTAVANSDARLGHVLAPALERATATSIRNDPRILVDILQPVIGPAIRKSVGETIDNSFQSLNESLRQSLSWRGLRWRIEAWRTGKPFAEVVLNHSLVYQVEHVFLIHSHSGLLISHVAAPDAASQDPQLVSSMLTAIQDFVRDSFKGSGQQAVDTLRLGDLRLWCEAGPSAMVVAVIRGNPPEELRGRLRDVIGRIHQDRRQALESFDGDSSGLADIEAPLAECAAMRQQAPRKRGFPWLVLLLAMLLVSGVAGATYWRWEAAQEEARIRAEQAAEDARIRAQQAAEEARIRAEQAAEEARIRAEQAAEEARIRAAEKARRAAELKAWSDYLDRLRAQPGIVVTEANERDGRFIVSGLRDPLAADPLQILRDSDVDPQRVTSRWQPYQSMEPRFVLQRLEASLKPPPSVTLRLEDGRIVASGAATPLWIARARTAARELAAGGPTFDVSELRNIAETTLGELRRAIQSHEIRFNTDEALPSPGQDGVLDTLAGQINQLTTLASSLRLMPRFRVAGHSDDTGPSTLNLSLSVARAGAVVALLKKRGVPADLMTIGGAGNLDPAESGQTERARSLNRRVTVTVRLEDEP